MNEYLAAFPYEEYRIYTVPMQGAFYIEPFKDDEIKNVLRLGRQWQPPILQLLHENAKVGTTVLDIGAHIGTFTIPLSRIVGENGCVIAFEPQKKIYRELVKNCELNGVTNAQLYRLAVGDRACHVEMDRETLQNNEGSTQIGSGGDPVEMRTIDSFELNNVSLVKIDVEGYEQQVLEGMEQTVLRYKPAIVIEVQHLYVWETAPQHIRQKIIHTMETLEKWGYLGFSVWRHDYLALPIF
jgi:FkbM family methyltransferase